MLHITILFNTGEGVDWYAEKAFSHQGDLVMRNGYEQSGRTFTEARIGLNGILSWTITAVAHPARTR